MKNRRQIYGSFLRSGILFLGVFLIGCTLPVKTETPTWQATRWNGETAWVADSDEWRAIVSVDRARLIYLGPKDGLSNLLYAPPAPEEYRPRGGHIFWLGPQSEWIGKWGTWPPPDEWEQQAARLAQVQGARLNLMLPRPDEKRPQLKRSYCWREGVLLCRVSWSEGQGNYQAFQILQLPPQSTVQAQRLSRIAPGFVRFDTKGKQEFEPAVITDDVTLVSDKTVRLDSHVTPNKYGFIPHTLDALIGDYGLEMGRGETEGCPMGAPDRGFETQVYLGGKTFPFVEIEQLTPRLKNRGATENAFTIWIKLRHLPPPSKTSH